MLPDRVSNPGPLTYESGVLPIALRGPAIIAPDQEIYIETFKIFFNVNVCCLFSLESPHRGDSNEYTQYTIFNIKYNITLN